MKKISDKELDRIQGGAMNSITTINTDAFDGTLTAEPINETLSAEPIIDLSKKI